MNKTFATLAAIALVCVGIGSYWYSSSQPGWALGNRVNAIFTVEGDYD